MRLLARMACFLCLLALAGCAARGKLVDQEPSHATDNHGRRYKLLF